MRLHSYIVNRPAWWRYGVALALFGLALRLQLLLLGVTDHAFLTFYPACAGAFFLCGAGPGLLVLLLAAATGQAGAVPGLGMGGAPVPPAELLTFVASAAIIGWVIERQRSTAADLGAAIRQLSVSERRHRAILEDQTDLVARFRVDGTLLYINAAFARYFGLEPETVIGRPWTPLAHDDDLPEIHRQLAMLHVDNPVAVVENRVLTPTMGARWCQFVNRGFFDAQGRLYEIQSVGRDVHERKQAETALKEATLALEEAQRLSAVGSWSWHIEHDRSIWSAQLYRVFRVDPARPAPSFEQLLALLAPDSRQRLSRAVRRARATGRSYELELELLRPGERPGWVLLRTEVEHDARGHATKLFGTVQDITERKRAEIALRETRDRVRELSKHLEERLNVERRRIAGDVHDELGQMLTAIKLELIALQQSLGPEARQAPAVARLNRYTDQTIGITRQIASSLYPPALEFGLVEAIDALRRDFELRTGIRCTLRAPDREHALPEGPRHELYRIVQESLNNVARHSGARRVWIVLDGVGPGLELRVFDDGRGFDPAVAQALGHFGLMGMRERALRIGADLLIETRPGAGTTVRVLLAAETSRLG